MVIASAISACHDVRHDADACNLVSQYAGVGVSQRKHAVDVHVCPMSMWRFGDCGDHECTVDEYELASDCY